MEQIFGNDILIQNLRRIASGNRVPHGIIFSGIQGTGKKMIASAFAEMLGTKPVDLVFVETEKENLVSVNDIRKGIRDTIEIKPYESAHKIYIVDHAEQMNVQAQNALLKTIEEPPSYAVIILLSENTDAFLQTILSRCVVYEVRPLPENLLREVLQMKGYPGEKIEKAVRISHGSVGKAVELMESEEFSEMLDQVVNALASITEMDMAGILQFVKTSEKYKAHAGELLEYMRLWFLDVLFMKTKADETFVTFREKIRAVKIQAEKISLAKIHALMDEIDAGKVRLSANVNFEMTMELLMIQIRDAFSERK